MASRLFAPASSERVDNSVSEVKDQDNADNEPTKRRSSSLVGDLAASILGADVLSARKAPPPFPDAEDASDGTRYFFAGGGRIHAGERPGGGCVGGSRPCGGTGGWDGSRARTGGWNDSFPGGEPGGRNGSCAGPGGPDDRCSVAVQLQLSPNGGRRRPRLRDAAAASGASGRNDRRSAALHGDDLRLDGLRRLRRRRRPDGQKVRMEQLLGPAPHY